MMLQFLYSARSSHLTLTDDVYRTVNPSVSGISIIASLAESEVLVIEQVLTCMI
jgi:hypothetical protein